MDYSQFIFLIGIHWPRYKHFMKMDLQRELQNVHFVNLQISQIDLSKGGIHIIDSKILFLGIFSV